MGALGLWSLTAHPERLLRSIHDYEGVSSSLDCLGIASSFAASLCHRRQYRLQYPVTGASSFRSSCLLRYFGGSGLEGKQFDNVTYFTLRLQCRDQNSTSHGVFRGISKKHWMEFQCPARVHIKIDVVSRITESSFINMGAPKT